MITQEQYLEKFREDIENMYETTKKKNSDYSTSDLDGDAYKNFKLSEYLGIAIIEKSILGKISDKISRISNLIKNNNPQVKESIQDSLLDLANYSIMLKIYLDESNNMK